MTLNHLSKKFGKLLVDNSPVVLTAVGVTGLLSSLYLTARAAFKASDAIFEEHMRMNEGKGIKAPIDILTTKEKVKLVWKYYIPPTITTTLTIAAMVGSNRIGTRRAAALAAAYAVSEKAFEEYRGKIIEKLGSKKEEAARVEIAQELVRRDPPDNRGIIVTSGGSVLCLEAFTGRYFLSDFETLRKAENEINHQIIHDGYASLSDLYDKLDLPHTSQSQEVGWNSDRLLDLQFSTTLSGDNKPCIVVNFYLTPIRNYASF